MSIVPYLSPREFAEKYGVSISRVYAMIKNGDLVSREDISGHKIIPHSELSRLQQLHLDAERNRGRGSGSGHKYLRRAGRPRKNKPTEQE